MYLHGIVRKADTDNTGQQNIIFFQNVPDFFIYSGAEWYPKHDVALKFSIN